MSNEANNKRRLKIGRWLLLLGGLFVMLLIVFGLFINRYGPPIGTIFTRLPPSIEREGSLLPSPTPTVMDPDRDLDGPRTQTTFTPIPDELEETVDVGTVDPIASIVEEAPGPEGFIESPEPGEPALPPTPVQVAEMTCTGPPADWIEYTIQAGDTLTALALTSGSSVTELQRANCLTNETLIAGALFYLPQVPPSPTAVRAPATAAPTATVASETAVAELVPTAVTFPPTPVPITSPPLPEESTSLLWFLWIVMLALLIGAIVWIWRQRRQA